MIPSRKICQLCVSPYKKEIVEAHLNRTPWLQLYQKYAPLIKYKSKLSSFIQMVDRHIAKGHNIEAVLVPSAPGSAQKATLDQITEVLRDKAFTKAITIDPKELKFKDYLDAEKTIIAYKKLQITEDAMTIAMGKMFGPSIKSLETIDGEVIEDGTGRSKDSGNQ